MLLSQEEVLEILRCPKTGSRLRKNQAMLRSEVDPGIMYEIVNGYPILIDFESSVVGGASEFRSPISRSVYKSGWRAWIKKIVSPIKAETIENVKRFGALIKGISTRPRVLVIGGGTIGSGMQPLYDDPDVELVAFDIYASANVQIVADAHCIPFPSDHFHGVIVQAVLEHVLEPERVVSEIHRVLQDRGAVYAETPFMQHVHEGAYDFYRYTESGHRYLFRHFELTKSGALAGAGTQLLWSIDFFFRALFRSRTVGKLFKLAFFWLQYLDRYIPETYSVDAASAVYFLGRKHDSPFPKKLIIRHYMGAQK